MIDFQKYKRIVVKVGSSTLTHESGSLNLGRIEKLVRVLSDFKNAGKEIVLVSSGAVSAGVSRLSLGRRPASIAEKQAMAAVGQSQLMNIYERFFSEYGLCVAQLLLTKDVIDSDERRDAAKNTFRELLALGCIPIVNENDPISTTEIEFGGNDTLSSYVALVCGADILINLSDIDALYTSDPRKHADAERIAVVERIDERILAMAGGAGSDRGTGGMLTKLRAAQIVTEAGIPMVIASGIDPHVLYDIAEDRPVGTLFMAEMK